VDEGAKGLKRAVATDSLIFCVDAGGTRCRGRLVAAGGVALAEAEAGPCNPATDLRRAADSLNALWAACAGRAGHDPADLGRVTLALGGAGLSVASARLGLLAAAPPFARAVAMSDGYAALIGAGGGRPAGLIIAGTGVAGHRLYPDGSSIQRDGWGWIGGDRGSGAWIGQRALRHTLAVADGLRPCDRLAEEVTATLRAMAPEPRGWIPGMGPDRLAALAPLVLDAAAAGEPAGRAIRDRAVEHLAALAGTLDLGPGDALYLAGGLALPLRILLEQRLGRSLAVPQDDALTGCYLVAIGAAPAERVRAEARP
jgi:glucosamine kinase